MFQIAYFNRRLGRPVVARFANFVAAQAAAEDIFRQLGIVVGIERI